jgi:hypothetical protein
MSTYTVTTAQNIDALTAKTGGDIYNINGGTLTIDQHSRFGLNNANTSATAATSMGTITLSATLGGICNIDGRYVRLIQYTAGSGTIPALNSLVTQGGASGKLVCVYSSMTVAPVTTGTIPATGWIMIKQWNSVEYTSGALTLSGITATSSGASKVGFLEIFGDDASTVNANRLGVFNITGAWYDLGTTNGAAGQTFQIPNHGTLRHIGGVYIEKTVGSGNYEFYRNGGTTTTTGTTVATGNDATRGKVCWINASGLVTLGNSGGTGLNGYVPVTGLKVVIGNVFLCCCTATARNAEVIPSATIATRYDFTTTGGGVVNIDKCTSAWYLSFAQPYSVQLTNTATIDGLLLSECATPITWSKVGVGNKPTTALLMAPLTMSLNFAGGTLTDCVWGRVSHATANSYTNTLTDISGFTFVNNTIAANTIRANATTYAIFGTRVSNCTWTSPTIIQGSMFFVQSDNVSITNTIYCDAIVGTTVTTYAMYVWSLTSSCSNFNISGLTMPVTNTQPYTALLGLAIAGTSVAGISNIKLRNIGTRAVPLTLGSANATGLIYQIGTAGGVADVKIQRVYCSNTRTGIMTCDNSATRITEENVWGDYADAVDVMPALNMVRKGMGGTGALTAQVSTYGTHWRDGFTSTTAGRIAILMNEPSSLTTSQVTLANGSAFTSAGGLYMPVIGHDVLFETPEFLIGHTGFSNTALVMAGGTATNYGYKYQINKNDGAGWSTESATLTPTTLGTALSGLTGISAILGFKLRLRITTSTTNATAITSVYLTTTSTTTAQDYQYPLDTFNLTLSGLITGSDVVILTAGTETVLNQVDQNVGSTWVHTYELPSSVDIFVSKAGYVPFYIRNYALQSSNASLPIAQTTDRNFII